MKTIAIANQKGGTGKTTTTYNLGIALTQQGYRVLMVDFDPQGNLSCYCGIPPEKDLDQTITELLMKTSCEKPIGNRECVYQTGRKETAARVDFIPSNLRLAGFELAMGTMMCREVLLKSCLEQYNNQYDYCLIDCSPSVGLLLTNALAAANEIIIPMQAQPFSVVGMSQLTSSIANVQRKINPGLRVKGILLTMTEHTNVSDHYCGQVRNTYGNKIHVFTTEIPRNVKVQESQANAEPTILYDPKSNSAKAYIEFAKEVSGYAAKNKFLNAMKMPSIDDMFSSEADRQRESGDLVTEVPLSELHPFVGHPFEVRDDEDMQKLVDSIRENGVLTNLTVRRRAEGGYEIISGHRRFHAAQRAGLDKVKVQVRDIDDDQAIIDMVDSNIQREHISPMEKARAYAMKLEAISRQGARQDLTSAQVGRKLESAEIVGKEAGDSRMQVRRYIRLNNLVPDLQKKVDDGSLKFNPAVELSYLSPTEQNDFLDYIESQSCSPSLSQAQKLKAASKDGALDHGKLLEIMDTKKPSVPPRDPTLTISVSKIARYFPTGYTQEQMVGIIMQLLERNSRHLMPEKQPSLER